MAVPTFRAAGAWSFTANNVASPFTCTPGAPAGVATGDLLVLVCESRSITATVATPAGWTPLTGFPKRSATASGGTFYVFTRIADGTANDTPSPVWTGQTTGTTGDASGAGLLAYQNGTQTNDATAVVQDLSAQGATSSVTGITTITDNDLVLVMAMKLTETSGQTASITTYTERADNSTTSGTGHVVYLAEKLQTLHGASGAGTITWSATTSARALIVSIALQPSLTSPTTVSGVGAVSSVEAFGIPDFLYSLEPIGLTSTEAFGIARLVRNIGPTGAATSEAFGTPTVSMRGPLQTISGAGGIKRPTMLV